MMWRPLLFGTPFLLRRVQFCPKIALHFLFVKRGRKSFYFYGIHIQSMAHFFLLGLKIPVIVRIGRDGDGHPFDDLQSIPLQTGDLFGIIGHKPHFFEADVGHNLRPDAVVAQIRFEAQHLIRLHGIRAVVLQCVRLQFIDQADAAPPAPDRSARLAGFVDLLQRVVQLAASSRSAAPSSCNAYALSLPAPGRMPRPSCSR